MVDTPVSHQTTAPSGANEHQPRLVLRFALYAGAVLLAAGLAIAWLVNQEVANRAERTVESQGARDRLGEPELRSSVRRTSRRPVSPARRATLDRLFRHEHPHPPASSAAGWSSPKRHDHLRGQPRA